MLHSKILDMVNELLVYVTYTTLEFRQFSEFIRKEPLGHCWYSLLGPYLRFQRSDQKILFL